MNHDTIVELLPWYVNGTLAPHERAAVESELASCPRCAAELEELKRLHDTLHQIDADAPGPSEQLFARTLARVDESRTGNGGESPLRRWWNSLPALGRALVFTPAALIIVLIAFTVYSMKRAENIPLGISRTAALQAETAQGLAGAPQAAAPPVNAAAAPQLPKTLGTITTRSAAAMIRPSTTADTYTITSSAPAAEVRPAPNVPRLQRPQLIRTGSISLIVPDVERALAQMSAIAQVQFGDVVSLSDETPSQPGVRHTASVQLSVPADRFDQTLDAVGKLGAVASRTIGAENVSDQIVDAQARLRNLRRTEADMLRILDRAGKIPDVLEVTQQIASVREQIEQLDGQLQSLQKQVAYSTISISLQDEKPVATAEPSTGTQLNDAWRAAVRNLRNFSIALASNVLAIVAFAPYWLPVVLIAGFFGYRLTRKP